MASKVVTPSSFAGTVSRRECHGYAWNAPPVPAASQNGLRFDHLPSVGLRADTYAFRLPHLLTHYDRRISPLGSELDSGRYGDITCARGLPSWRAWRSLCYLSGSH